MTLYSIIALITVYNIIINFNCMGDSLVVVDHRPASNAMWCMNEQDNKINNIIIYRGKHAVGE